MSDQQKLWTHDETTYLLQRRTIADLERLIADSERKYRQEFAATYTIQALKLLAESEVLPDDIRSFVVRILELHEKAADPFLGMNLSAKKEEAQS